MMLRRRAARGKEIATRLDERRGIDASIRPRGRLIWLHAASVGETVSVLPVLRALAVLAPDLTMLMTTGTVTSADLLIRRMSELGLQHRVLHRFAPLDVPTWVARFLDRWRPDAAAFVESEIWPNQLLACRARSIPLMLLNARLSSRSQVAWGRAPALARHLLSGFARIQARGDADADRLRTLGALLVETPGDLKFAAAPLSADQDELARLRDRLSNRPVWLAASTHPGEELHIAAVHHQIAPSHPGLLTIIAPRHPDRGQKLARELAAPRRSAGEPPPPEGMWIVDTLGEMGLWYRLAPIAFVGRSLLPPGGGQNPLEPARLGCAIATGLHTANFTDHVTLLRDAGGLVEVADQAALTHCVTSLLDNEQRRKHMGDHAAAAVQRHADLPDRTARALLDLLPPP
jgi:3-deoxy-D-manno-octulosonic-acid transferase